MSIQSESELRIFVAQLRKQMAELERVALELDKRLQYLEAQRPTLTLKKHDENRL